MPLHFQSVTPVNPSGIAGWKGVDIYFERVLNPPPEDNDIEDLRRSFEAAVRKLRLASRTEDQFMPIFNQIIDAARSSLATPGGNVKDGTDRLEDIRTQVLSLARSRRGKYFVHLLLIGIATSVCGLIFYIVAYAIPPWFIPSSSKYFNIYESNLAWVVPSCLILPGAAMGVVFVGFATNRLISYENIERLDKYDFVPWQRFVWIVLLSYALLIVLWFDIFVLGVGNIVLNKVSEDGRYGLLIGLVCGISEALITELIISRLQPVAEKVGGAA